jgi:hypothetical protein
MLRLLSGDADDADDADDESDKEQCKTVIDSP